MAMGRPRAFDTCKALDAAMDVFWRKSYQGASIVDLTTAMGINAPSLYAAFGSKEGLFRAVLERYDEDKQGFLTRVLEAPTGLDAVTLFLKGTAEKATEPGEPAGCLLVQCGLSAGDEAATIPEELAKRRTGAEITLRGRLECAKQQGELPAHVDPSALARYIVAVSNGMCLQAAAGASRATLYEIADMALGAWPGKKTDAVEPAPAKRPRKPAAVG